jgi:hypothetical protein
MFGCLGILPHQMTQQALQHPPEPVFARQQQAEDDTRDGRRGPDDDGDPHIHLLVPGTCVCGLLVPVRSPPDFHQLLFEFLARVLRLGCLLLGLFQPFLEPLPLSTFLASIRVSRLVATTRERDSKSNRQ